MNNRIIELCPDKAGGDLLCKDCPLSISVSTGFTLICAVSGDITYSSTKCTEGEDIDDFIEKQSVVKDLRKEVERLEDQVEELTDERDALIAERDDLTKKLEAMYE